MVEGKILLKALIMVTVFCTRLQSRSQKEVELTLYEITPRCGVAQWGGSDRPAGHQATLAFRCAKRGRLVPSLAATRALFRCTTVSGVFLLPIGTAIRVQRDVGDRTT